MNKLNIPGITCDQKSKYHSICMVMIASRIIDPQTKILTHGGWECDQKDLENNDGYYN